MEQCNIYTDGLLALAKFGNGQVIEQMVYLSAKSATHFSARIINAILGTANSANTPLLLTYITPVHKQIANVRLMSLYNRKFGTSGGETHR